MDGCGSMESSYNFELNFSPDLSSIEDQATDEDTDLTIPIAASDVDIIMDGQYLTFSAVSGDESLVQVSTTSGDSPGTGTLTMDVQDDQNGTADITVTVTDSEGSVDSEQFTLTVNAVNDSPVADAIEVETVEDTPVEITLTGSDIEGDGLTFSVVEGPLNGTLSGDLIYTPDADYNGADSFTFSASDGSLSDTATVSISVSPVNDAPVLAVITHRTTMETVPLTAFRLTDPLPLKKSNHPPQYLSR
jgi:hypothetical protein